MAPKSVRRPRPGRPITIEHHPERVIVTVAGRAVAHTRKACALREASLPPLLYVRRENVDLSLPVRSDRAT
jgi:uncharacterized protein (DUF427 family)